MKIEVLKTTKAASSPLGNVVKEYKAGQTYEIFDCLAKVFLDNNWGINPAEKKKIDNSPENKAIAAAAEKKQIEVEIGEEVPEEAPKEKVKKKSNSSKKVNSSKKKK